MIIEDIREGQQTPPTFYAVPLGQAQYLPEDSNWIELDISTPVTHQLHTIPPGSTIKPLAMTEMPVDERNQFLATAYQAILSYQLSQQTYGQFGPHWITNSLDNYDAFINSKPVNELRRNPEKDFALICGNGTSFHQQVNDIPENAEVFACWRVVKQLVEAGKHIDYACHLDHMHGPGWAEEIPCPAIAMPQADPKFIRMAKHGLYGYFDSGKVCSGWFASKQGVANHHHVVGTVAHMMVNAAIYAGHKDIVLLGIDHAWLPGADYDGMDQFAKTVTNRQGKELRTEPGFQVSVTGLSNAAASILHEGRRIWQASDIALDMEHIEYKALSEWQTR
jgi:hypothetical protein